MQTQIICPSTGAELSFDVAGDDETATRMWQQRVRVRCPLCEGVHERPYREIYVTGLMDQFGCVPADMKEDRIH